jgi:hypothetical protein
LRVSLNFEHPFTHPSIRFPIFVKELIEMSSCRV